MQVCSKEIRVYGRLVRHARLDADGFEFVSDPGSLLSELRNLSPAIDIFSFTQRVAEQTPLYSYRVEWENSAVLPVSTFDNWWTKQVDKKTRNMVRKAEKKGVVVREVPFCRELVQGISEIYNECPIRQGRPFRHYRKPIESVTEECSTFLNESTFLGAYLDAELIGFVKLTADELRTQLAVMNIVSMVCHRDKAPTNALIAEAIRICISKRIPYLVYSSFDQGDKQQGSLNEFKSNNGFQRFAQPRYYVPLTSMGRFALAVGLHHRLIEHVPESLRKWLREVRGAWYNRKVHAHSEPGVA